MLPREWVPARAEGRLFVYAGALGVVLGLVGLLGAVQLAGAAKAARVVAFLVAILGILAGLYAGATGVLLDAWGQMRR
jgi:hypothetical protein